MHLDDGAAPGALVEQVDVLRHDGRQQAAALELRESRVRRIGLSLGEHGEARRVEAPHLGGIPTEGAHRCVLERVELGPDPGRRAKVRNAALGGDAGTGEGDARLVVADQGGQGLGHGFDPRDYGTRGRR